MEHVCLKGWRAQDGVTVAAGVAPDPEVAPAPACPEFDGAAETPGPTGGAAEFPGPYS